jgi:RNA polymerase sigma-70 factor (ECF subfamily)
MEVNSEPALVLRVDGQLDGVFVLSIEDGAITDIRVVRNPEKLAYLGRQLAR